MRRIISGLVLVTLCLGARSRTLAEECGTPLLRVSNAADGQEGDHNAWRGYPSVAGEYVCFPSVADNLLPGDGERPYNPHDVFRRRVPTDELELVSVALDGTFPNGNSKSAWSDCEGQFVAFNSSASDLVEGDTNGRPDVFVRYMGDEVTIRVSVSSKGEEGNGTSQAEKISGDGRYVAFASWATNLIPEGTSTRQVFMHDLWTRETTLVSLSSDGEQGNSYSYSPRLSYDGRYVAFESIASNLAPTDPNRRADVYVHDTWTGTTTHVSLNAEGETGNGESNYPSISGDGRYVAFSSAATNFVPDDNNGAYDAFVVDWQAIPPVIERVSVSSDGEEGNDDSVAASISADGRLVVFSSYATNLVPEGAGGGWDIYVHDRVTHETKKVSTTATGGWGDARSLVGYISCDGTHVAFLSSASNLIPADTNGYDDVYLRALEVDLLTSGDGDCDGDIDFADFAVVQRCFTLHWYDPPVGPECYALDFNFDGDVDRRDFAEYLDVVSGPR